MATWCYMFFGLVLQSHFIQIGTQLIESDPQILLVQSIRSLSKGIAYFNTRGKKVTDDEILALRFARDALFTSIENCKKSPSIYVPTSILEDLKLLCARLNVLIPRILNVYKPLNMTQTFKQFLSMGRHGFLPYKSINVDKQNRNELKQMVQIPQNVFQRCLGDLTNRDSCTLSEYCKKVVKPEMAHELSIIYQAVILSKLQLLGCSSELSFELNNKQVTIEDLADEICFKLYPQVSVFHATDTIQEGDGILSFFDAFFVCTLLGFEDFLQVTHLRLSAIIEWQLPEGCFGVIKSDYQGEKCSSGITSAAIAQLALYIKWLLDPKGYTLSSHKQIFTRSTWFSFTVKIFFFIVILTPFFVRKARKVLLAIPGRIYALVRSYS